ncbi:MAG: alpha-isopropylmalate synthase regulatory domain-containing protein [Candidatus Obscuribacterales bacterium]
MKEKVSIFDTTLRDGQQCPGAAMSLPNNLAYFKLASAMKIDIIEAGFPSASNLDFQIVNEIASLCAAQEYKPTIAALCQLRESQVVKTIESLEPVIKIGKGRLHTYVPVDPELMEASLGELSREKSRIIEDLYRMVKMASDAGLEVQFSPEGYSRMRENFDFTSALIIAAIEGGASIINCPDTIGGASSLEGRDYFVAHMKEHARIVKERFPERQITWSVHCHNDFGLAVQNSINAVFDGPARQIEGCINGIGERAGNASLEQCIMIIEQFGGDLRTGIDLDSIQAISDFVCEHMLPRQPHWPVTGANAARHSSGGHTNAILKNPMAYQPFDPRKIGKEISFTFGPLSGGNHARSIIESYGFVCAEDEKAAIAQFIKDRSRERRKGISDEELIGFYFQYRQPIHVDAIDYGREKEVSRVSIEGDFFFEKGTFSQEHQGKDSALAALKTLVESRFGPTRIISHQSHSDRSGYDAQSVSTIVIEDADGNRSQGTACDQDIEISAMRAYIDAVNKSFVCRNFARSSNQGAREAVHGGEKIRSVA